MIENHLNNNLKKKFIYLFNLVNKADKYLIIKVLLTSTITAISESLFITFTSLVLSDEIKNITSFNVDQNIATNKGILLVILAILITFIRIIYLRQQADAKRKTSNILNEYLIKSYLYNKYESWKVKSLDEFNNLFIVQIRQVGKAFGGCYSIVSNIVVIFLILFTGFIQTPFLTTSTFIIFPAIYVILGKKFKPLLNKLSFGINQTELKKLEIIKDSFFLKESIMCDGNEKNYENRFYYQEKRNQDFVFNHSVIDASPKIILEGICYSIIGVIFMIPIFTSYKVNIQELIIFALVLQRSIPLMQMVFTQWNSFQTNIKQIDDIYFYLLKFSKPKYSYVKNNFENKIEFKNVSYKNIFKGISIIIEPGDKIALTGESGSGKTTLAMLIAGIIKHSSGSICIDEKELNSLKAKDYFKYIESTSFCSYKPYLVQGNLVENITFKREVNKFENFKIKEIVKSLNIHKYWNINDLSNMSGGERQRVAIARVIYNKSKFVILDEITSSLDVELSEEVLNYVFDQLKESTIILITHKPIETNLCNKTIKLNCGNLELKNNLT